MQTLDDITPHTRRRSKAWIYYALLAICAVIVGFSQPTTFLVAIGCALYSRYIYRGGSIVVWLW